MLNTHRTLTVRLEGTVPADTPSPPSLCRAHRTLTVRLEGTVPADTPSPPSLCRAHRTLTVRLEGTVPADTPSNTPSPPSLCRAHRTLTVRLYRRIHQIVRPAPLLYAERTTALTRVGGTICRDLTPCVVRRSSGCGRGLWNCLRWHLGGSLFTTHTPCEPGDRFIGISSAPISQDPSTAPQPWWPNRESEWRTRNTARTSHRGATWPRPRGTPRRRSHR